MTNPVSSAASAAKSAFTFRFFFQLVAGLFLFYLVMGVRLKFLPKVFAPIYRLITNPLSFVPSDANNG